MTSLMSAELQVDVWLRGTDFAKTQNISGVSLDPASWTDHDVSRLLKEMLLAIYRAKNPESTDSTVYLRGFSWIVEPTASGVVIAIEIPMGAAVAGPFAVEQAGLDRKIRRVIAAASPHKPVVH